MNKEEMNLSPRFDFRNNSKSSNRSENRPLIFGYNIEDIIEAYKSGGIKAVKQLKSKGPNEETSHRALEEKDMTVPGVGLYYETKK